MGEAAPARPRRVGSLWDLAPLVPLALLLLPLSRAWSLAPDLGHGWAAPLLIAFLWWDRWNDLPAVELTRRPWWLSGPSLALGTIALLAALVPLRLLLTPFPLWPAVLWLHTLLLVIAAGGLMALRRGPAGLRWLIGPLVVLPGVIPWPGVIEQNLILPLREGIALVVTELSNLMGQPALASGTTVRTAGGWVGIDEACGGIRSLQATVTAALFAGEWLRFNPGRRLAMGFVAVAAAMLGNLFRVTFLTWCATLGDDSLHRWHDVAGWSALAFSLGLTALVASRWRRHAGFNLSPTRIPPAGTPWRTSVVSALVALALLVGLLTIEFGTRIWFGRGPVATAGTALRLTATLPEQDPSYRIAEMTDQAREMLQPDDFRSGTWLGADQRRRASNVIEWRRGQVARFAPFQHNPTICLTFSGCELVDSLGTVAVPWRDTAVPFHTYHFSYLNEILTVAYTIWDPSTGAPLQQTLTPTRADWFRQRWQEVVDRREDQPAQLIAYLIAGKTPTAELMMELQSLLTPAAETIVPAL